MNISRLKKKLIELAVNPNYYSLDGSLKADAIVLCNNYGIWNSFYIDERGNKHDELNFPTEKEACEYVYLRFKKIKEMNKLNARGNELKKNNDLPDVINL